jgi:general secretion pathway protein L
METLVIRLPVSADEPASWVAVDASGARLNAVQTASLSRATPLASGRRVVVLVPGAEVLLAEPELPVRGGARLAQVVPFALEEQLADDLEDMHFAIGRHEAERPGTPVATVRHASLQEWLARLQAAQLYPDAIFADSAVLPAIPGHTVILVDADRTYSRRPGEPPIVLHAAPLAAALELAVAGADASETHAIVYLTPADWATHQATFNQFRSRLASLRVQLLPDGTLPLLAQQAVAMTPINLLQGSYAPKSEWTDAWRAWRLAAVLAASLVGLNLLGKGVEIWRLHSVEKQLDASIEQVFREAMPGEQNAIDARRRMESRLQAIRGGMAGDGNDLVSALGALGGAVAQVSEASLEALSFRAGVLDLKVAAKDVGSLERLRQLVAEQGLTAELQSSNQRADGVEGRIQIRAQGSS